LKHTNYNTYKRGFKKEDPPTDAPPTSIPGLIGFSIKQVIPGELLVYKYKYNGKEWQDELGLNVYDYGWRNYMPDIGRWTQIDPLFNDLKFANDNSQIEDEDDQDEIYMAIINDLELGGGIYNTDNLNPYGYGYNNPVSFDDPDGRCPSCVWGAVIGAAVEYGGQVAANLYEGKSLKDSMTDIDVGDVLVSAGEGALTGGVSAVRSLVKKTAITVGAEIVKNTLDVKVKGGKPNVKVNDAKSVARNTIIGLAVNGAGKAIPSTKVKVKSEVTPKQAVKTARANGVVNRAQRKEIQNQAKKTLKENKAINKTVNEATSGAMSGGAAEIVKRKEDKANGN
jgi:RHS repeat-associated protein